MVSLLFKRKSGAVFFTLDTLIAGLIVLVTIMLIFSIHSSRPVVEDSFHEISNYMNFISSTTMRDVRNEYSNWYSLPEISTFELDLYVHQMIYKMYLEGETASATKLVGNLSPVIIPNHFGFEYAVGDFVVYQQNNDTRENNLERVSVTNRLLTFFVNETGHVHITTTNITVWTS